MVVRNQKRIHCYVFNHSYWRLLHIYSFYYCSTTVQKFTLKLLHTSQYVTQPFHLTFYPPQCPASLSNMRRKCASTTLKRAKSWQYTNVIHWTTQYPLYLSILGWPDTWLKGFCTSGRLQERFFKIPSTKNSDGRGCYVMRSWKWVISGL